MINQNMSTEITNVEQRLPWSQKQIGLITRTVARGATADELGLFLYTANRTGLDPLTRQIHFVKRKMWNKDKQSYDEVGTIQTGIDGYRTIAARTGELAGIDDAIYDSEENEHPNKATVTVYRIVQGNRVAFTASARWNEYAAVHPKTGKIMGLWAKMPYLMLGKCAESLSLRKAFAFDLADVYTEEELSSNEIAPPVAIKQVVEEVREAATEEKKSQAEELMNNNHVPLEEPDADEIAKALGGEVIEESKEAIKNPFEESNVAKQMRAGMAKAI